MSDRLVESRRIYDGRRVNLRRDLLVDAKGREYVREVVEHPGAAVIVPALADGAFVFVRQYRYALDAWLLELPAGTLEPGEEPAACAARELPEETGYRAGKIERLGIVYPSPGILTEVLHIFLAEELVPGPPDRDVGERMEVVVLARAEVREMLRKREFTDGKTVVGLSFVLERP